MKNFFFWDPIGALQFQLVFPRTQRDGGEIVGNTEPDTWCFAIEGGATHGLKNPRSNTHA